MTAVRSGRLRHQADIQSLQGDAAKKSRGQTGKTWKIHKSDVPVDIAPLRGRELEIARQVVPTATHRVTMRYIDGVTPNMRFTGGYLDDRILNIDDRVDFDERGRKLVLTCTEVSSG